MSENVIFNFMKDYDTDSKSTCSTFEINKSKDYCKDISCTDITNITHKRFIFIITVFFV